MPIQQADAYSGLGQDEWCEPRLDLSYRPKFLGSATRSIRNRTFLILAVISMIAMMVMMVVIPITMTSTDTSDKNNKTPVNEIQIKNETENYKSTNIKTSTENSSIATNSDSKLNGNAENIEISAKNVTNSHYGTISDLLSYFTGTNKEISGGNSTNTHDNTDVSNITNGIENQDISGNSSTIGVIKDLKNSNKSNGTHSEEEKDLGEFIKNAYKKENDYIGEVDDKSIHEWLKKVISDGSHDKFIIVGTIELSLIILAVFLSVGVTYFVMTKMGARRRRVTLKNVVTDLQSPEKSTLLDSDTEED